MNALGSVVLVLGVLLLPLQIWQGSLLDAHHLQWADFFLGAALLIGAFGNRDIVVHLARTWGPFWLIAISSSLLNGTPYVLLRGLGLVYVTSLTALIPMFFPALRRRGFDLLHAMGFLALGFALLDGVLQGVGLSEPYYGQNAPLLEGLPRLAGSFLHPNGLAHFLAMTGFLTIFFHRSASGSWIVWVYGATLVLTISRSVVALPLWVLSVARRRITVWLGALGLFLIVGISVFFSFYAMDHDLRPIESFRWKGLQAGLWTLQNNFWMGHGPGTQPLIPEYAVSTPGAPGDAMNTYVNILSTTGLLGFVTFIYGWIRTLRFGRLSAQPHWRLWFSLIGFCIVTSFFISSEDFRHLYLLIGWMTCLVEPDSPRSPWTRQQ